MSLAVGLTGTVGCGKTTVAGLLASQAGQRWPPPPAAAVVIDADALAREVVEPGQEALEAIVRQFGPEMLDAEGRLRRAALAKKVFVDRAALARLEAIVHPRVRTLAAARVDAATKAGTRLIVLDVPLLLETEGMRAMVDRVVVVTVGEARRFGRLRRRSGLSEAQTMARLAMQMPQARKAALADAVIDNDGDLEATERQCERLLARWVEEGAI
jgi:dephospho-CoA kinase